MTVADAPRGAYLLLHAAVDSLRVVSGQGATADLAAPLQKARDALACANVVYCAVDGAGRLTVRASSDPVGLLYGDSEDVVTMLATRVLRTGEVARSAAGVRSIGGSTHSGQGPSIAVPVVSDAKVVGVLSAHRFKGEPEYSDEELDILTTFGDFLGVVTDVEQQRAAREAMVEAAVRERLGQALFDSVISDLLRATTGIATVLDAVHGDERDMLVRYVRTVDRAIAGFREILAGDSDVVRRQPGDEDGDGPGPSDGGRTLRFPGTYAPGGDWGWSDGGLLDEMNDYIAAILGDVYKVTTQLASTATTVKAGERRVIAEAIAQLDALTGRIRGAAGRIRASDTEHAQLTRLNTDLVSSDSLRTDEIALAGHDARATIGVVLDDLEALEQQQLAQEQTEALRRARRAARRTYDQLERILALATVGNGQFSTNREPLDLARWLPELLQTGPYADQVTLHDVPAPGTVLFDPAQLAQILTNLLGTTVRHGAAPVELTVRDDESSTRIEVTAAGAAVPPDAVKSLFERPESTTVSAPDGPLGPSPGLHLSRHLAQANGADLTYEPGPDEQCGRFVLNVPR